MKPTILCRACNDFGITNLAAIPKDPQGRCEPRNWFGMGLACCCSAGEDFGRKQMEWMEPMPEGRERSARYDAVIDLAEARTMLLPGIERITDPRSRKLMDKILKAHSGEPKTRKRRKESA